MRHIQNIDQKKLYTVMLSMYMIAVLLSWTTLLTNAPLQAGIVFQQLLRLLRYFSYFLAVFLAFRNRPKRKVYPLIAFVLFICLLGSWFARDVNILLFFFLFLASFGISKEHILKVGMYTQAVLVVTVVLLSQIIPEADQLAVFIDRVRHGLGFTWVSFAPYLAYYATLAFLYLYRRSLKLWMMLPILGLHLFFYYATDTKMALFSFLIFLLPYAFLKQMEKRKGSFRPAGKKATALLLALPPAAALLSYLGARGYQPENEGLYRINYFLSKRLEYGANALAKYPMTLLGQRVEWVGHNLAEPQKGVYNFVDGSYLHILLQNGLLILLLVIGIYMILLYRAAKAGDRMLCLILIFILCLNITEERLMAPAFNPFPLLLLSVFPESSGSDKEKSGKPMADEVFP